MRGANGTLWLVGVFVYILNCFFIYLLSELVCVSGKCRERVERIEKKKKRRKLRALRDWINLYSTSIIFRELKKI